MTQVLCLSCGEPMDRDLRFATCRACGNRLGPPHNAATITMSDAEWLARFEQDFAAIRERGWRCG